MEGNLINRLNENKVYTADKLIHEGDDITRYDWSDRRCYYVTKVVDQKHIFIHSYSVCADKEKANGMGHQEWKYFKTATEMARYLNEISDTETIKENSDIELVYRYNKWQVKFIGIDKKIYYRPFGNISIGVRDYHYDWEF